MFYVDKQIHKNYWSEQSQPTIGNLYAIVDMAVFNKSMSVSQALEHKKRCFIHSVSLFENTPEAVFTNLAPYLCLIHNKDFSLPERDIVYLQEMEQRKNGVVWLWSEMTLLDLQKHLQTYLNGKLKSGREVLFRFYDPRVMPIFLNMLHKEQANQFWGKVNQCMLWDGKNKQHQIYRKEVL